MVFFTCNSCGESLKKNKVDQHAMRCYGCQFLTCIDCSEDFWGDDYKLHISCITEDQKYGSSSYKAKPNKGEVKQNEWMAKVCNKNLGKAFLYDICNFSVLYLETLLAEHIKL